MTDPTPIPTLRATADGTPLPEGVQDDGYGLVLEGNDGNLILLVTNGSGETWTVHITPQADLPGGLSLADTVVTVPDSSTVPIGPFPPVLYNDELQKVLVSAPGTGLRFVATGV